MVARKPSVLIVDDEQMVCDLLYDELSERGYLCTTALSGDDALAELTAQDFNVVLVDIRLPGMSGMELLAKMRSNHFEAAAVMITAVSDVNVAIEAMKLGALDYIIKPFDLDRIDISIRAALETKSAAAKPSPEMDAIARGVEAKLDPFSTYSKAVTEKTVEIARQLGVSEAEIQRWTAERVMIDQRKSRILRS